MRRHMGFVLLLPGVRLVFIDGLLRQQAASCLGWQSNHLQVFATLYGWCGWGSLLFRHLICVCGACSSTSTNTGRLTRNFLVVCVARSSTAAGSMLALHMCSGTTRGYQRCGRRACWKGGFRDVKGGVSFAGLGRARPLNKLLNVRPCVLCIFWLWS